MMARSRSRGPERVPCLPRLSPSRSRPIDSSSAAPGAPPRRARRSRSRILPRRRTRPHRRGSAADVDAAVAAARAALDDGDGASWGRQSAVERGRVLAAIGKKVLDNVELLAALEVHDVGKPLKQARADAIALARYGELYGGACDKVHGQTLPFANGYTALTLREPHGVTGHIVPWNYPMQIVGRSVGGPWRWATPAC